MTILFVALYLIAIVIANVTVATFGAAAVIPNALVLVALDLTARDVLHERWHGDPVRLGALILAGSLLSAALDYRAIPVAIASSLAFALSEAADTVVYTRLRRRSYFDRVNGSNVVSAAVDSAVFLALLAALGGLPWALVPLLALGQWIAKVAGGVIWSIVLRPWLDREEAL